MRKRLKFLMNALHCVIRAKDRNVERNSNSRNVELPNAESSKTESKRNKKTPDHSIARWFAGWPIGRLLAKSEF